jgi:uncharacterized SAM-binding protein YcdF (DUF218 family)
LFVRPRVDPPERADAIVVLDGDRPRRLARGVALAATGIAPTLVVVRCEAYAQELLDGPLPFEVLSFVPRPSTTRGEARAIARLVRERGWTRLLVVTSTYHVTRTRLIFERALDCELGVTAAGFTPARLPVHVLSEWLKLLIAVAVRRAA